jgi:hypothetical protein
MSLAIDVDKVEQVLLTDGSHRVRGEEYREARTREESAPK